MCTEIAQFSSFLRRRMSAAEKEGIINIASESHPQIQTVPQQQETDTQIIHQTKKSEDDNDEIKSEEEQNDDVEPTVSVSVNDDDDGFKTPTSSDHRIPPIKQCPPAPKKLRPPPSKLKRKAPGSSRTIQLDSSAEVDSIFSPIAKDEDDDAPPQKIKKARTDD